MHAVHKCLHSVKTDVMHSRWSFRPLVLFLKKFKIYFSRNVTFIASKNSILWLSMLRPKCEELLDIKINQGRFEKKNSWFFFQTYFQFKHIFSLLGICSIDSFLLLCLLNRFCVNMVQLMEVKVSWWRSKFANGGQSQFMEHKVCW